MPIAPPESPAVASAFRPAAGQTVIIVKNAAGSTVFLYDDDANSFSLTGNVNVSGQINAHGGAFNGQPITGVGASMSIDSAVRLDEVSPLGTINSGALPTQQFVSGTAAQVSTSRDVEVHTPVTFNPGVATIATCTVALSPDNVTFSTLVVWTVPVGVALDGTIQDCAARVPAGWYLKLTASATATLGLSTYF